MPESCSSCEKGARTIESGAVRLCRDRVDSTFRTDGFVYRKDDPWYFFRFLREFDAGLTDTGRTPTDTHPLGHTLAFGYEYSQRRADDARSRTFVTIAFPDGDADGLLPRLPERLPSPPDGSPWNRTTFLKLQPFQPVGDE